MATSATTPLRWRSRFVLPLCAGLIPATAGAVVQPDDGVTRLDIARVADQPVTPAHSLVIGSLADGETFDVQIGAYGLAGDDDVYLCAKPQDAEAYHCFGPATHHRGETGEVLQIVDVRLSSAGSQARQFVLRAVALAKGQRPPQSPHALDAFHAVSAPAVQVAVLKWAVGESLIFGTINGHTIDATRELAVEPTADASGLRPRDLRGHVHIMLHWIGSTVYHAVPVETRGGSWYARDVRWARSGFPHWRNVDAFAFVTDTLLPEGDVDYQAISSSFRAVSPTVKLWVKDDVAPPPARTGEITVISYAGADGVSQRLAENATLISIAGDELALEVTAHGMTQGASIFAALTAAGTSTYVIQNGPAVFTGKTWTLPHIRLAAPGERRDTFYLYVFEAQVHVPFGPVDYATWQRSARTASRRFTIQRDSGSGSFQASDIDLQIRPALDPRNRVEVDVHDLADWLTVQVGVKWVGDDRWTFMPASQQSDTVWTVPAGFARRTADGKERVPEQLVAIAASGPLDPTETDYLSWRRVAWKTSPILDLPGASAVSPPQSAGPNLTFDSPLWRTYLGPALFILLVLVLLQYLFGATGPQFRALGAGCTDAGGYVREQFSGIPRPDAVKSVLALILLAFVVFGVMAYYPLYRTVLKSGLSFSGTTSGSLAFVLIMFVALTGIIAHVTFSHWPGQRKASFGLVFAIVILMAVLLLGFEGIVYGSYYAKSAPPGTLVPPALAAAAVFIGAAELLAVFWGCFLGIEAITWLLFHIVLVPLMVLGRLFGGFAQLFDRIPQRGKAEPRERPLHEPMEERRDANV